MVCVGGKFAELRDPLTQVLGVLGWEQGAVLAGTPVLI